MFIEKSGVGKVLIVGYGKGVLRNSGCKVKIVKVRILVVLLVIGHGCSLGTKSEDLYRRC